MSEQFPLNEVMNDCLPKMLMSSLAFRTYLDRMAEELNDKLLEAGMMSIAELCKAYDLPGDFLTEVSQLTIVPCATEFPLKKTSLFAST